MYDVVIKEFKRSGLSQADLARRLGLGTDRVCRLLGGPGNWTLDTSSDLLFAISGAEPVYGLAYPLDRPASNRQLPDWLDQGNHLQQPLPPQTVSKVLKIDNRAFSVTSGSS